MWHRMRARADLFTILFLMTALLTLTLTGSRAYLAGATEGALTQTIAGASSDDRVMLVQTRYDTPEQVITGTEVIAQSLPGAGVHASIRTPALPLEGRERERLSLSDDARITGTSDLISGHWPQEPGQTAVHHGAAEHLGLAPGEAVTVVADGVPLDLTITGTWMPSDLRQSQWGMDPTSTSGVDPSAAFAFGPALVSTETILGVASDPFIRWQILPDSLTPGVTDSWLRGLTGLAGDLTEAGVSSRGILISGGLDATLLQAQASLRALQAVVPIPYSLLTVTAGIAIWQVLRLLSLQRRHETTILRARGGSAARLTAWSALEGAAVAVPAAALGGALSLFFDTGTSPWAIAGLIAAGLTAAATLAGVPHRAAGRSRLAHIAGTAALVLLVALAAFTLWRLLRSGGTLVPGTSRVDLLALSAPAAVLLAAAGLAVAATGPILAALAAFAARTTGLSPVLEARLAARRGVGAGSVVLLVALGATAALATTYWGTWQNLRTTSEQVSAGADLVVEENLTSRTLESLRGTAGVQAAAPVVQIPYSVGDGSGELTALPPAAYAATSAPPSFLPGELAEVLGGPHVSGPELPRGTATGSITVSAAPHVDVSSRWEERSIDASLLVWDGDVLERVPLASTTATTSPATYDFTADLPGPGPWRVIAVDTLLDVRANTTDFAVTIDIEGADFTGFTPDIIASPGGAYTATGPLEFTATLTKEHADFDRPGVPTRQRWMAQHSGGPAPIAVTPAWQGAQSATAIRVMGQEILVEPVATVPVVPGNPSPAALLIDAGALTEALLRAGVTGVQATQAWVKAGDPGAVALAIGEDRVRVASSAWAALSILVPLLLLAMAALALVLALPAIGAGAMSELRSRRLEVSVMRAVGAGPRTQSAYRRRELLLVYLLAVGIGAVAGALLAWAIAGPLIRSTTPQVSSAVPLTLAVDWLTTGAFALALAGAGAGALWWYGRRVSAQVRDRLWREDA